MNAVRRLLVALGLGAAAIVGLAQSRPITLLVPPFDGPEALGINVATILNLQVWQTLRKAPYPNPSRLNFGDGLVTWSDQPLASQTHDDALRAARQNEADLVLWGKALRYGAGVVVQSHLTIATPRSASIWRVQLPGPGAETSLAVSLPRLRYEFGPIVLTGTIVETYSTPDALRLYSSRAGGESIGKVGSYFTAIEQNGTSALVRSGDVTGWIRLPSLSSNRSEIVDFVGGIMRIMRADWGGADALFARALANPQTPAAVKLDAHLYRVVALEQAGSSGIDEARRAYALNSYDRSAVSYLVMSEVAAAAKLSVNDPRRTVLQEEARRVLDSNRFLFPSADEWFTRATVALTSR
jgi:hypothetical protein